MTGQFDTPPETELRHTGLSKFSSFPARLKTVLQRRHRMAPTEQPVLPRVLLVEDDDGVRAMVYATLEPRGFDVGAPAKGDRSFEAYRNPEFRRAHHRPAHARSRKWFYGGYGDAPFATSALTFPQSSRE